MTRKDAASLVIVVLFGLILQVGLIFLDCTNSPADTAVNYLKAYYKLSPEISEWLCAGTEKSATCENSKAVDHIYNATAEAAERGFADGYTKYALSHIETETEYLDDTNTTAVVHLTAHRHLAINPLYAWFDRLFRFSETHEVDESIRVKKEDGRWRVCKVS